MSYGDEIAAGRPAYRPTGLVNWLLFLPGAAVTIAVAAGMSFALSEAFFRGYYYLIFAPLIAMLPVLGVLYLTLVVAKCRSRVLALLLAVAAAGTLYPGYYHACLVRSLGPVVTPRLDLLPHYIVFRMETDEVMDAGRPNQAAPQGPDTAGVAMNWFMFGMETFVVWVAMIGLAVTRTSRAYCNQCRRWTTRHVFRYAPGSGSSIAEAIQNRTLASVTAPTLSRLPANASGCELIVEYCGPNAASEDECPVYVSLRDVPEKQGMFSSLLGAFLQNRRGPRMYWLFKQIGFSLQESSAIGISLPRNRGGSLSLQTAEPIYEFVEPEANRSLAMVEPVQEPFGGSVLTKWHLAIGTIVALSPALLIPLGIGMFFLAATPPAGWPEWSSAVIGIGGFVVLAVCVGVFYYFGDYLPSLYLMRICKREFDQRPDAWVDHRDGDAIAIQVIPRKNWGRVMLENASDVGFLRIDSAHREILFEGDFERYHIPVDAIAACDVEAFANPGDQTGSDLHYMVVIRALTANGPWETSIAHRHVTARRRGPKQRKQLAMDLHENIRRFMDQTAEIRPTQTDAS